MKRGHFTLWHSFVGISTLVLAEWLLVYLFAPGGLKLWVILVGALIGAIGTTYVATEIVEEVKSAWHMLILLSIVMGEFVVFFAFQYCFLLYLLPESFPTLTPSIVSLLLHSIYVFVFNPLFLPSNEPGEMLLAINTLGALGLVLFILQNVGQFRSKNKDL